MSDFLWWQDGIIYQIYPRSFADSDGDGLGDLPGITARLDYLATLGVDAIWLSPIYPSPDRDFGYDVADHTAVDPRFGTLADFERLVQEAHRRGIRIVLDLVLNHTSDQHAWFRESRRSREDPKRDWYIWRPPAPLGPPISGVRNGGMTGGPPNNWQASFGGRAWEYDPASSEYYLHLFTREQPDVNWRNPQVRQAQLDVFRFWLERGVDGFRLDVFNAYFKHADLPDNPPKLGLRGFDRQRHVYDIDQPEMIPFLNEMRRLLDSYPERYAVGETYLSTPERAASYCGPDRLHAAFSFDFTTFRSELAAALHIYHWNPAWIRQEILARDQIFDAAGVWPTTVMSNHDLPRAAGRYGRGEDDSQARLAMALLLTLRGTPFMYYGEEIGMRDISLRRSEILDPPGRRYWPIYKGRDGCRSPMQWDGSQFAGFSTARPWLPVHPNHAWRNVAAQEADPGSLLHFTRKLIALRREHPALRRGDYLPLDGLGGTMLYLRRTDKETILVALNFSGRSARLSLPEGSWQLLLASPGVSDPSELPPLGVFLAIR
jgi:alpha-glucosidase